MTNFAVALLAGASLASLMSGGAALGQTASPPSLGSQSPAGTTSVSASPAPVAPGPSAARIEDSAALGDIIVTARRREESLQSVPVAVQAFDGAALDERRIENATDLSKLVPALTSAQSSRDEENYVIRGNSGSGASISGQQVTVTSYLAQVPLPIGDGGGPGRYFDLQNVQVLKGPQGTLFGRNSTGGAVLFEPRRPGNEFGGYVEAQAGNYKDRGLEGALNIPLTETLKIRIAGKAEDRDGFTKNITTGQDQDNRRYASGRLSILWKPTSSIENIFVGDMLRSKTNGSSNHLTAVDPNATIPRIFGGAVQAQLARQDALGPYVAISSVPGRDKVHSSGFSNITTISATDNLTLKNIVGLRRIKQLNRFDYDGSPISLLDFDTCATAATCHPQNPHAPWTLNVRQWTEEFQIQGKLLDDRLNYTLGIFGANVSTPDANYSHQTSVFGSTTDVNQFVSDRSRAVYGQLSYNLSSLVNGLTATAGYRRTNDKRGLTIYQVASGKCVTGATGTVIADPANAPACRGDFEAKFTSDSYTFGLDWKVSETALVYVAHRKGYRAGGTNPLAGPVLLSTPPIPNAASLFTYAPETLKDVELGLKADWDLGGDWRLRTNLAAFTQTLDNAQLNQTFSVGTSTVSALVNASTAKVKGIEAEATLQPTRQLSLQFAFAYTDAKYGRFLDYSRRDPVTNGPLSFTGRAFPFTPKTKFNAGATYRLPLADNQGELSLSANYAHKSSITLGLIPFILVAGVNTPDGESVQKPTDVVDLNFGWKKIMGSNIDADLYVTNLLDTTYKIGGASLINSGLGVNQRIYNEPRMYGLQLRYRFGA